MQYFIDLVNDNGDNLVLYNQAKEGKEYVSVFDYSSQFGGTYDSQKYYNEYVVELS
mgnify:CR=1 FL=1